MGHLSLIPTNPKTLNLPNLLKFPHFSLPQPSHLLYFFSFLVSPIIFYFADFSLRPCPFCLLFLTGCNSLLCSSSQLVFCPKDLVFFHFKSHLSHFLFPLSISKLSYICHIAK